MADEPIDETLSDEEVDDLFGKPSKKGGLLSKLMILIVGVGIGGGAGFYFVGPMVGERLAMAATPSDGGQADDGSGGDAGEEEEEADPADFHLIENLVVNPAESEGTRFLLISIAVQMASSEANDVLIERDMELRDALLRALGQHSVAELSDINARDFLIDELKVALQSVLNLKVNRILIPQFVIQ